MSYFTSIFHEQKIEVNNTIQKINEIKAPITLYHGSVGYYEELRPFGIDLGNKFQKPGWSLFTWTKYDYAIGWAIWSLLRRLKLDMPGCIDSHIAIVPQSQYNLLKENIDKYDNSEKTFYIYTIIPDMDSEFGLGHSSNTPNCITIRKDHIIPYKTDTYILDMNMIDKYCKIVDDDYEPSREYIGYNGRLLSFLMTNDFMLNMKLKRKISSDVKSGVLSPGDNLIEYLENNGLEISKKYK